MNTGNKILGKHIRQFLHKNNVQLRSLMFYQYKTACRRVKQRQGKDKKSMLQVQICFFANQQKKRAAHAICFLFLLIRSISLETIFIVVSIQHYTIYLFAFFCLDVLLTRASLLALAHFLLQRTRETFENVLFTQLRFTYQLEDFS